MHTSKEKEKAVSFLPSPPFTPRHAQNSHLYKTTIESSPASSLEPPVSRYDFHTLTSSNATSLTRRTVYRPFFRQFLQNSSDIARDCRAVIQCSNISC